MGENAENIHPCHYFSRCVLGRGFVMHSICYMIFAYMEYSLILHGSRLCSLSL